MKRLIIVIVLIALIYLATQVLLEQIQIYTG